MFSRSKKGHISELVSYAGFYLGPDVEAEGDIITEEDVYIDGVFKGSIATPGAVELGKNSNITGSLSARSVTLEGKGKISIKAVESLAISGCAEFNGTAIAKQISIETGAAIDAKLNTGKN